MSIVGCSFCNIVWDFDTEEVTVSECFSDLWSLADSSTALSVDHIVSVVLDFCRFFALLTLLHKAQDFSFFIYFFF